MQANDNSKQNHNEINNELKSEKICCTWKDKSNCAGCNLETDLDCRWDRKHLIRFFFAFFPTFITILVSFTLGGIYLKTWWTFGIYFGYLIVFFTIEVRILCSHCPYYSEDTRILHCLANHGFYKYCTYHPEPMSGFEKNLLRIGFILFAMVPLGLELMNLIIAASNNTSYGITQVITFLILLIITIITAFGFFYILFYKICTKCVNFSCPFNKVEDKIQQSYLEHNPMMKEAWENSDTKKNE